MALLTQEMLDYFGDEALKRLQNESVFTSIMKNRWESPPMTSIRMGRGIPDLEEFDRVFSPDRQKFSGKQIDRVWVDELEGIYGAEHILSDEQIAASRIERKNRWLAKIRNRAWHEVVDMRRTWIERNRVYGPGTDFGAF